MGITGKGKPAELITSVDDTVKWNTGTQEYTELIIKVSFLPLAWVEEPHLAKAKKVIRNLC